MKFYPIRRLLLFSVFAFTIVACDSSETGSEEGNGEPLIPLAEGNIWTATNNATQETVELRVAGTDSISEQSYFRVNTLTGSATVTGGSANSGSPLYVQERDDGVYIGVRRSESELEGFFLRYPISDGSTYVHTNEEGDAFDVFSDRALDHRPGRYLRRHSVPNPGSGRGQRR